MFLRKLFILGLAIAAQSVSAQTPPKDPIAGPKSCFWARGPFSKDPYINIAYPDAATFYWAAVFTIPDGAKLSLEGNYPNSRYMSLISYDGAGVPIEAVSDYLMKPNAGTTNPFIAGADRTGAARGYSINVVDGKPDPNRKEGMNLTGETRDKIHAPKYEKGQQSLLYRIYVVNKGQDESGGAGLPTPVVTLADGKVLRGAEACASLKTRQPLVLDPAAMAVPLDVYRDLVKPRDGLTPFHPASTTPKWYLQMDREYLYGIYTGKLPATSRRSEGGFYPNPDNQYIRTIINRKLGNVFVLRGKAPTTPKTFNGDAKMGSGQLRYWSFCSNQGFANTRVNDCVHDERVPLDPLGYYTIVVSRKDDRPRNATLECGVAWLPMAEDGDGAVDNDVSVIQLRNMLGTENFAHSIQAIKAIGEEEKTMGEYFPKGRYLMKSGFEAAVPCLLEKRD